MSKSNGGWKRRTAIASVVLGLMLMLYMIIYEDEPGGVPLIMILAGGSYLIMRAYLDRDQD